MGFQPPIFGTKKILNFVAHSYPRLGTYFLSLGIAMSFYSFLKGKKEMR